MSRLDSLVEQLREEVRSAFERGYVAGQEAMRKRILDAAATPVSESHTSLAEMFVAKAPQGGKIGDILQHALAEQSARAARGAVGRMLHRMLSDHPHGLTATQAENNAPQYDPSVSLKSVGNELRRMEGIKYRRDESGLWTLIVAAENETAGSAPAVKSEKGD